MSIQTRLQTHKLFIEDTMQELLAELKKDIQELPYSEDTTAKLVEILLGGKMIRGSLICLTFQMLSGKNAVPKEVYKVAVAEEIFATVLLIHDDIIDKDRMRRGKKSLFAWYEEEAQKQEIMEATHYGYSQAMMVGDICFFWVQKILATIDLSFETRCHLQATLAQESMRTGFGQMLDVNATMLSKELSQEELESIALNKTARYTFVLPFLLGATLADADTETKTTLELLGNAMGVLFQIKDDEMGLFGSESETGKPEGNDVKEGKQTLFHYFAKKQISGSEKEQYSKLYGSAVTNEELYRIREMVKSSGAYDAVQKIMKEYAETSISLIESLPLTDIDKTDLKDFVEFNLTRNR